MVARHSVWMLVLANAATVMLAIVLQWPPASLMWPFLIQSLVIGYYSRKRILALEQFSTENFRINGQEVEATPQTQRLIANFFILHYGGFHLAYLFFLFPTVGDFIWVDWFILAVMGASFFWNHNSSYQDHIAQDRKGCPNIGWMMFIPYLRIVPMHVTIGLGAASGAEGVWALLFFGALKTIADVGMHYAEHMKWQQH